MAKECLVLHCSVWKTDFFYGKISEVPVGKWFVDFFKKACQIYLFQILQKVFVIDHNLQYENFMLKGNLLVVQISSDACEQTIEIFFRENFHRVLQEIWESVKLA